MAASSREERIALTESTWRAYSEGDLERVLATLDPEVVVHVPVELANSGTYRGREEFVRWIGAWLEAWESFDMEVVDTIPVGDHHVVSHMSQTGVGRGSGIEVNQELGWVFEFRDGLAVYIGLRGGVESALVTAREREEIAFRDG